MNLALVGPELFTGHEVLSGKALLITEGLIAGIVPDTEVPAGYLQRNLPGRLLAPGFVDLQIYGGNGKLFSGELTTESIEATYEYCLEGGCTHFLITMATNSLAKFLKGMQVARQYQQSGGQGLLGLHLEGPYINPAKRGAHLESEIRKPSLEEVQMLVAKGKGILKMMTLAPEQCDDEVLEWLMQQPILVSAGHSNATYGQASNGFFRGIPAATHLFNAMSPLQGREPGMVGAIYDHPDVMASIVCDGIHVDFASVRISKKILGERLFLITDAVAEVHHGEYQHIFRGDRYCLRDGTLSGSALTMLQAVRNAVEKTGIPLPEALRMASLYPARLMGQSHKLGQLVSGAKADLVLLDDQMNLLRVMAGGE
jgi:N-acetylglucosamine-6-phosphate deacetylase